MNVFFFIKFIFILKLVNKGLCLGGWGLIGLVLVGCMLLLGFLELVNFF